MPTHEASPDDARRAVTRATARRWKELCEQHWPAGTMEGLVPLLAPGAVHRIAPDGAANVGPDEIRRAWAEFQGVASDRRCRYGEPLVDGDQAVIEWWCHWIEEGERMTMVGVTRLWVDAEGLVLEAREYWNAYSGWVDEYDGWDRGGAAPQPS